MSLIWLSLDMEEFNFFCLRLQRHAFSVISKSSWLSESEINEGTSLRKNTRYIWDFHVLYIYLFSIFFLNAIYVFNWWLNSTVKLVYYAPSFNASHCEEIHTLLCMNILYKVKFLLKYGLSQDCKTMEESEIVKLIVM